MVRSIDEIVKDVEVTIDEIALNDAEFDGVEQDDSERATIIRSKLADAMRFVYAHADWSMLEPDKVVRTEGMLDGEDLIRTKTKNGITYGIYTLPSDFLRLCYAGFNSWSHMLGHEDIIMWTDKEYAMLRDRYTTGTPDRPRIAIAYSGKRRNLELYSCDSGQMYVDQGTIGYMTEPVIDEESSDVNIGDKVYRAVIYYIAGLTCMTYGEQQKAQMMFTEANDLMGFTETVNNNVKTTLS